MSDHQMTADRAKIQGNEAFSKKNYDIAIKHYTDAIELDDKNAVYYSNRSACYAAKGLWQQALDDATLCVEKDHTFIKGYLRLAAAQTEQGLYHDAEETLKAAIKIEPDNKILAKDLKELEKKNIKNNKNANSSNERHSKKFIDKQMNFESKLSEAEILRNERIKRNDEFLKSLGLASSSVGLPTKDITATKKTKNEKQKKERNEEEQPLRKSARRAGLSADIDKSFFSNLDGEEPFIKMKKIILDDFKVDINPDDDTVKRNKITAKILRDLIDETNKEHSELISDDAITHCVYRITSMSNKALGTRIKMIARAAGQHSYEKLLVFHYALKASGLAELAESSRAALNHIEGVQV